jgi:peptide/nickel transport system substrate-binding protein/oligopeptide transport system substrate-binding protein
MGGRDGPPILRTSAAARRCLAAGRRSLFGALALVAVTASIAHADGGVYRRPLGHDPQTLDPARISDIYSRALSQQIFDGLVQYDHTLGIAPALAQFWKASRDGRTWVFNLRRGVKFHDGHELTAEDVVFSLSRILDPRTNSAAADLFINVKGAREFREGRADHVAGLTAVDRHTVQVLLNDAPVPFVSVLAVGHAKILPRAAVERDYAAFTAHPIGTGPFKFVRRDPGREIVLAANPDYFDGPPKLATIVYRVFRGEQSDAMYEEFQKGRLEDTPVPTANYRAIVTGTTARYVKRPMLSLRFYGFNTRVKPFDDRRVRRAIVLALNRQRVVEDAFLGRNTLARGILPPGTLGFNPQLPGYPYDPAGARDLLTRAGYPGGRGLPPVQIWSSVRNEQIVREHELVARDLETVGLRADIRYHTDWPAFSRMLADGKLPIYLYAWYADVPDPDTFLFQLFHSASARNFTRYANPAVDDLLVQARAASEPQRRVDLYRRAEESILEDAPIIPMFHYSYERLFQPYVRAVEVSSLGDPYIPLRKIWLERTP